MEFEDFCAYLNHLATNSNTVEIQRIAQMRFIEEGGLGGYVEEVYARAIPGSIVNNPQIMASVQQQPPIVVDDSG